MVADGRLSAACASLLSDALSEQNEENLRKLLDKHPLQDIPENIPSPAGLEQIKIPSTLVLKMLRSFPKKKALPQAQLVLEQVIFFMLFKFSTKRHLWIRLLIF